MVLGGGMVVVSPVSSRCPWCSSYLMSVTRSIIPKSLALGIVAGMLALLWNRLRSDYGFEIVSAENLENSRELYSTFSFALGFLCVWRNGNAFSRWWDGIQTLATAMTEWLDAASQLVAATSQSKKSPEEIMAFNHVLTRLFSIMTCLALKHVATMHDEDFEVLNIQGLDEKSKEILWGLEMDPGAKMVMATQWVLNNIHQGMADGIVTAPPPIVSRVFQELANGTFHIEKLAVISNTDIPATYTVMVNLLLVIHLVCTSVVGANEIANNEAYTFFVVCLSVFVLWCINLIAVEIEHPFGDDYNDVDVRHTMREVNDHLRILLDVRTMHKPTCGSLDDMRDTTDVLMYSSSIFDPVVEEIAISKVISKANKYTKNEEVPVATPLDRIRRQSTQLPPIPGSTHSALDALQKQAARIKDKVISASVPEGAKQLQTQESKDPDRAALHLHATKIQQAPSTSAPSAVKLQQISDLEGTVVAPDSALSVLAVKTRAVGGSSIASKVAAEQESNGQRWRELAMEMQQLTSGILQQLVQQRSSAEVVDSFCDQQEQLVNEIRQLKQLVHEDRLLYCNTPPTSEGVCYASPRTATSPRTPRQGNTLFCQATQPARQAQLLGGAGEESLDLVLP